MSKPDIHRLIDLQDFLLQFRDVERVVFLPNKLEQRENDVEHSYHLALAAWFLAEYFPRLDKNKVIRYALVHDLVEVHAGDTYIFATDSQISTKEQREAEAYDRIQKDWADFPDMVNGIAAYESKSDDESRFVYALDKIMPILLAFMGKGYGWHKYNVTVDALHENKKSKVAVSPEIKDYYDQLYDLMQQHLDYFHPKQD